MNGVEVYELLLSLSSNQLSSILKESYHSNVDDEEEYSFGIIVEGISKHDDVTRILNSNYFENSIDNNNTIYSYYIEIVWISNNGIDLLLGYNFDQLMEKDVVKIRDISNYTAEDLCKDLESTVEQFSILTN